MAENLRQKPYLIVQMKVGLMENFVYLIGSKLSQEMTVVDPAWNVPKIIETAEKQGFKITKIFLTHTHFDHMNGLKDLANRTGAKVYVNEKEASDVKIPAEQIIKTNHDFQIEMGGFSVRCLHTPGHTSGSQCFEVDGNLFTGDTLFVGNCGRTDLPTSSPEQMYRSLQLLAALPGETIIFPGHNYGSTPTSTIEREKNENPCMGGKDFSDFLSVE